MTAHSRPTFNKPLKIAVVVKSFTRGGGMENYAVEVAVRLRDKGHQIDVYTREGDKKCCSGMGVFRLPSRFKFSSVLRAISLADDYKRALNGKAYDVIHSHERGYYQDVLTNHCFTYKGSVCAYPWWKRLDHMLLSPRTWIYLFLEGQQMKTRHLVGVSTAIKNDIYDHYQRSDVEVITPGVDCQKFHPDKVALKRDKVRNNLGVKSSEKVVLFVGSEFSRKGLDLLLPVAQKEGIHLLVVGRGDKMAQYRKKVDSLGISNKVIFTGLVDSVDDYYAAADLVVLPSNSEAFGMSILEAMACGLPVLVSENCGIAALIENGRNGFIVSEGSLTTHEALRILDIDTATIGLQARKTATLFSWDEVASSYETLFYKVKEEQN